MSFLNLVGRIFASTKLFVYGCCWLIVLLVIGTVAQRDIGLFMAQKTYFSSWIILLGGFLPVPGGRFTMLIVFVGLVVVFFRDFSLQVRRIGVTILHFGAIMLLVGGFLTAVTAREGSIIIPEGESSDFVSDYHSRELAIIDTRAESHDDVTAISDRRLKPGRSIELEAFPGRIDVLEVFENCQPVRRDGSAPTGAQGLYRNFDIQELPRDAENSRNTRGLIFRVAGAGEGADGVYGLLEYQSVPQTLQTSDGERTIMLRRARTYLPFSIELLDFEKKLHPGTGMARSYRSVVNLIEGDSKRRVVIQMNEPLRHFGYTFYQSSFIEGAGSETTVLAAVKNAGRTLPYISSLVMCFGLLVHLVLKVPTLIRSRRGVA